MAPSRFASLRGRSTPSSSPSNPGIGRLRPRPLQHGPRHIPSHSADDSALQLVALRYEQTVQAEPPIPIPPPRNPLRVSRPTTAASSSSAAVPSRSTSTASTVASRTTRPHITTALPLPPPPPPPSQPLPPLPSSAVANEKHHPVSHPPQRQSHQSHQSHHSQESQGHSSSHSTKHSPSSSTTYTDWRRDSALGSCTLSSASTTLPEDASDAQGYACAKLGPGEEDEEGPPSSIYSIDYDDRLTNLPSLLTTRVRSRSVQDQHIPHYSCQSRWSLTESDVSDSESFKQRNATKRLIRGLSVRLAPPMRRLKKLNPGDATAAAAASTASSTAAVVATAAILPATDPPPHPPHAPQVQVQIQVQVQAQAQGPSDSQSRQSHHHRSGSTDTPPRQLPFSPNMPDPASREIGHNDSQSPLSSNPGPLSGDQPDRASSLFDDLAPTIDTSIPLGSLLDDDDLDSLNFSRRGSVYFGGKRAIGASSPTPLIPPAAAAAVSVPVATVMSKFLSPRAAPAAPVSPPHDGPAELKPAEKPEGRTGWRRHTKKSSLPDIRVMSEDTERESQKVRSLYESGELIHWEDGSPGRQSGERLAPPEEVPSDGDDNIASRTTRENRKSVRAMYLSPSSPLSVTSLPSPRGSAHRHEFELAGGIEDWEDVRGADVDRYGFIQPGSRRPISRASVPAETRSLHTSYGRRNGRNVLTKKPRGPPLSQGLSRIPSRKLSARSLNTQTSEMSTRSRLSVRSGIRSAANMLPHNRDRKIIDAAADMLSLPPALAEADDEQKSAQAIKAAQDREARRTEKWRNMAKMVTRGIDNNGDKFATSDIEKVYKRAKKGATGDHIRLEIEGVQVEFDTRSPKLIERTWKGIPDRWRSSAWYSFLASSARDAKSEVTDQELIAQFHSLQEVSSSDDVQIDLDVPRTINRHIMFRKRYRGGQRLLFRVLHALSLYFPDTGYVQGMAALAASLLCYYDEERCFVMLVWLWQFRGLKRLYQHGFGGLMIALQDLEKYWLKGKPISQKLNDLGIDPTAYGTRWYLTLFNLSIPFPVQLRVWDVFILLGGCPPTLEPSSGKAKQKEQANEPESDMIFDGLDIIHATAAALIDIHRDVIIDGDFENVMKGLTSFQEVKDEDKFINLVRAEWNTHRGKKKG